MTIAAVRAALAGAVDLPASTLTTVTGRGPQPRITSLEAPWEMSETY